MRGSCDPDGYTPPRRIDRRVWPRILTCSVIGTLAAVAWGTVVLIGMLVDRVVSMFK